MDGRRKPIVLARMLLASVPLLAAGSPGAAVGQPSPAVVLSPAQNARMLVLPGGGLLISEPGSGPNRGILSLLDSNGDRQTFLGGLPSGLSSVGSNGATLLIPDGPDGLALDGNTLYVAIGEGDGFRPRGAGLPGIVPNPSGVSSPLLASVLKIDFSSRGVFNGGVPFFLDPASHEPLLDGATVSPLGGEHTAAASVLTAFRPGIPDAATIYRSSHPAGIALLENVSSQESPVGRSVAPARRSQRSLYVADSGTNRLVRVDLTSGRASTLVRFPDSSGTLQSVRSFGAAVLLVTLSGDSAGAGSVQTVDPQTGATRTLIPGLDRPVDAVARESGGLARLFVLENSNAGGQPGTGRVLQFDGELPLGREVATGLNDPVSLAIDEGNGRLLISSRGDGVILFVPLP